MYEQEFQGDVLYIMFYAVVAALNLVVCFSAEAMPLHLILRHPFACVCGLDYSLHSSP